MQVEDGVNGRTCTKCGESKLFEFFNKKIGSKYGYNSWCKACEAEYGRRWNKDNAEKVKLDQRRRYADNPEKVREANIAWRQNNPDKVAEYRRAWHERNLDHSVSCSRNSRLKSKYGVDLIWYESKLHEQEYVCALCSMVNESGRRLAVDHDHNTNLVRGLLCMKCNFALERLDNVEDWTIKAVAYVAEYKSLHLEGIIDLKDEII